MAKDLAYYMALPWNPTVELNAEGDYSVTVPALPDFRFYFDATGGAAELDTWKDALRAHLQSYLATATPIPEPGTISPVPNPSQVPTVGVYESGATWRLALDPAGARWQRPLAEYQVA